MLKINKNAVCKKCHFNLTFMFKSKNLDNFFLIKKKTPYTITLRSPKHFNIGKNKIATVNSKVLNMKFETRKKVHSNILFQPIDAWNLSTRRISQNTFFKPKTVTLVIQTQFKINVAGILVFTTILNAIIFSFIFWILTFISKYYYSNKYYNTKLNYYECGFKSLTQYQINYSLNFLLLVLFLLLYDGEFLIIIPFSLNVLVSQSIGFVVLFYFLIWLYLTLLLDYIYSALDWQV